MTRADEKQQQPPEFAERMARTPLVARPVDPAFSGSTDGPGVSANALLLQAEFRASEGPALYSQPVAPLQAVIANIDSEERMLPLALIGPIETTEGGAPAIPDDPERRAFCDTAEREAGRIACYLDLDGDGRFDTLRHGITLSDHNPLTLISIIEPGNAEPRVSLPIPYRIAADTALPVYQLRYNSCDPDSELPTYAVHLDVEGDADIVGDQCTSLAQELEGDEAGTGRRVRIDRVVLALSETEAGTRTHIVEPIPAGAILDRIGGSNQVFLLGARPSPVEELTGRLAEMTQRPVYGLRNAPTVASAEGDEGSIALVGLMQYGYTGRLLGDAGSSGMLGLDRLTLPAGQPVYGVPFQQQSVSTFNGSVISRSSMGPPRMYWCAPFERRPGLWRAHCFLSGDVTHRVYRYLSPAFMVRGFGGESVGSEPIQVEEGPDAFGDVEVRYRFDRWTDEHAIFEIEVGPGVDRLAEGLKLGVARDADGSARFVLGDGEFRIVPGAGDDGYRIETISAGARGGPLFPMPVGPPRAQ